MRFWVLTIFPDLFAAYWHHGIVNRAITRRIITADTINIRDFAEDKHSTTDDRPYGGGSGMVMKPEPLVGAIKAAKQRQPNAKTILLTPQGRLLNYPVVRDLSRQKGLILVCGRYEGVDERVVYNYIDDEISIGDYVLTGGELAAMLVIDAVTRLIPGALGNQDSADDDSFVYGLLEHAQYTRPQTFEGNTVPEVLRSGNHRAIDAWRRESSLIRTYLKRKELLIDRPYTREEIDILKKWCADLEKIIRKHSSPGIDSLSGDQ